MCCKYFHLALICLSIWVRSIDFITVQVSSSTKASSTVSSIAASRSSTEAPDDSERSSSGAAIGGAVAGGVLLLLLLAILFFCWRRRKQRKNPARRPSIDAFSERPLSPQSTPILQPFRQPYTDSSSPASTGLPFTPTSVPTNPYFRGSRLSLKSNLPSSVETPSSAALASAEHLMVVSNPEDELPPYVAPGSTAKGSLAQ